MRVIPPIDINPEGAVFGAFLLVGGEQLEVDDSGSGHEPFLVSDVATNVPEDDASAWDDETTWTEGQVVMREHRLYEALIENTNIDPSDPPTNPPTWLDLGATNRWLMFDGKVGSKTVYPESIELSIVPGAPVNAIGLFGVEASSIEVSVIDPYRGTIYRSEAIPTKRDHIRSYWEWFFSPLETREDIILTGVPATAYAAVQIRILRPGADAAIGELVLGSMTDLGCTKYGLGVGIRDFSRKETDPFGNFIVVERGFSKRAEFDVSIDTANVSFVQRTLAAYRARPIVWIGADHIEATVIFGYYRDFQIVIAGPRSSDCSISVEGLT